MDQEEPLKNERLERVLSPHPLSFMKLQFLCIFLIIWGIIVLWLVNFSEYTDFFGEWISIVIVWALILILFSIIASILTIRWIIFFLYLGLVASGIGLMVLFNWYDAAGFFLPIWSVCMSILGFLFVEVYRRSHKYLISNLRIVFSGGIFTKRERTLRYDKISDINSEQGILGQIFGFGTIIPISQSGFGLGTDQSFAAGGVKLGEKKVGILGLFGGGREVQTPRARSYYELHGVHPYKEIKKLVESAVQESVITPYQQEQVAYQKEQVDVQKQMRDLLKKQMGPKEEDKEEKNPPD
jgi:hypothetical protein